MSFARFAFVSCLFLCAVPVWTQQTSTQPTPSPAQKDPQAVNIANQTIAVGGGQSAILAIKDYKGSGNIKYHQDQEVQGAVTVSGLGLGQFREDATLPTGARSFAIGNNQGTATKNQTGVVRPLNFRYQNPLMKSSVIIPCWQLAAALNDPLFAVSYRGTTQIDGLTVYDVRIQLAPPGPPDHNGVTAEYFGADFFIDAATFQIHMTQDVVIYHLARTVRYSSYKPVNGVSVPFSIDEEINGNPTRTIQLSQIIFNAGLQDSDFDL
jgi:hypothetical protein